MTRRHPVTYSLGVSLDGYIYDASGDFEWADPDDELFRFATDEVRGLKAHLLGRRLYEAMLYWERDEPDSAWTEDERTFADLWGRLPKVVFSRSLASVTGRNTRLAEGTLAEEIERLQRESGEGTIGIGGADLAQTAIDADLLDEYRIRFFPMLVGGGARYFADRGARSKLELVETRTFPSGVLHVTYRRVRD